MAMREIARESYVSTREAVFASGVAFRRDTLPDVGDLVAGKYRIERRIGAGSMGVVFAARHELLGKAVALKLISEEAADTPQSVRRFYNEARAAAQIDSDHVARVLDVGHADDGAPFMALELLDGCDLAELLEKDGPRPVAEVVGWVLEALEAIAEAHAIGIVHRDLKPANLFLAHKRDGTSIVKVLDFGISKNVARAEAAGTLTATSSILGSPTYMAPEQLRDAKTVDARADIWAIGVVLYELLSGQLPFAAQNVADLFVAILERTPPSLRAARPEIPPGLEEVVVRCLSRDIDARFGNVATLAEALAPFGPPGADAAVERIRRLLRDRRDATRGAAQRRKARSSRRTLLAAIASLVAIAAAGLLASHDARTWCGRVLHQAHSGAMPASLAP
jgi:serine/threonine-protein kinase